MGWLEVFSSWRYFSWILNIFFPSVLMSWYCYIIITPVTKHRLKSVMKVTTNTHKHNSQFIMASKGFLYFCVIFWMCHLVTRLYVLIELGKVSKMIIGIKRQIESVTIAYKLLSKLIVVQRIWVKYVYIFDLPQGV